MDGEDRTVRMSARDSLRADLRMTAMPGAAPVWQKTARFCAALNHSETL